MENKIIIITGGNRGLGKALAELFISKKAKVIISGKDSAELENVAQDIGAIGILADVTKETELTALAEKVISQFGQIDIWINNAGIWLPHGPFDEADLTRTHQMFEVNVFGTIYGSRTASLQMKKRSQGTIVNVISISALEARPNSSLYSASKFAVRGFTDSIREELKENAIRVISIYPEKMKTDLFDEAKPADYGTYMEPSFVAQKIVENLEKEIPDGEQIIRHPSL